MNKLLVLLIAFSLLLGVFGFVSVMADHGGNHLIVEPGQVIMFDIKPMLLNFGGVSPGTSSNHALDNLTTLGYNESEITLYANGSNVDVHIEIDVSGEPFKSGLRVLGSPYHAQMHDIPCDTPTDASCTYTPLVLTPTLDLTPTSPAGVRTGIVTYTVTGTSPV